MIVVVNKREHKPVAWDYFIGRPSTLGNPFKITPTQDRASVLVKYKEWLERRFERNDPAVMSAIAYILEIEKKYGKVNLVCFCKPLDCHGDIIKEFIEGGRDGNSKQR